MDDKRIIRFDWAVKRMLRNKANFGILEGLIQVLTGRQLRIVEILESEANQDGPDDKFNRVDIMAKDASEEIFIVEVQVNREIHYLERILYGTSKAIADNINLGDDYDKVKKVYSINVLYFNIGEGLDYLYHGTTQFVGVHSGDQLKMSEKERGVLKVEAPADIFPEYYLIRVNQFNDVATTPLEEWIDYLKNQRIKPDTTAPGLQEARLKLEEMLMTPEERRDYQRHMQKLMIEREDIATAKIEGYGEGRKETLAEVAKRMKEEGIDPVLIQKITGRNT